MKNKLIVIGYIGLQTCYLNISEKDATQRYIKANKKSIEEFESDMDISIYSIEFDDEFGADGIHQH